MPAYANQHYVPVFYSKRWADGQGQITRYFFDHGKVVQKRRGPTAIGCKEHLWTLRGGTGDVRQFVEKELFSSFVDNDAGQILRHLIDRPKAPLSGLDVIKWAHFLGSLELRNPLVLKYRIEPYAISIFKKSGLEWKEPYDISAMPAMALAAFVANGSGADKFLRAEWSTLDVSRSGFPLLTCDWPLLSFKSVRGHQHPMSYILPLSPKLAFLSAGTPWDEQFFHGKTPNALVRMLNMTVTSLFMSDVWAPDDSQAAFIFRRMKERGPLSEAFLKAFAMAP